MGMFLGEEESKHRIGGHQVSRTLLSQLDQNDHSTSINLKNVKRSRRLLIKITVPHTKLSVFNEVFDTS